MKRIGSVVRVALSAAIVIAGLCYVGQTATAQNSNPYNIVAAQDQMQDSDNPKPTTEANTFVGKIIQSGNQLVLSDVEAKKTYKLDDQQKAKEFVNKNVKISGVLDASTGMIRVTAIEPA